MTRSELDRLSREAADSEEYRVYREVREWVLRTLDREASRPAGLHSPSAYWAEELEKFDYLLDAPPLIVRRLRHHCYHLTGLKVYDYRSHRDKAREAFEAKRRALLEIGGRELLVPESPRLGGFGHQIDGALYNIDTLKFYEALIALDRGGVLKDLRGGQRRLVWEIGAGWGGFAYQLKSVAPSVTIAITDFPELFLFSAVYLRVHFPEARCLFVDETSIADLGTRWPEVDFVFIPNGLAEAMRPDRLDLTVNMVSFQEMTTAQVRAYVERAFDLRAPYLYSLNRDRSPYNPDLTGVRQIIAERYWPHEIPVLPVGYTKMLDDRPPSRARGKPDLDYHHLVGWRRVQP